MKYIQYSVLGYRQEYDPETEKIRPVETISTEEIPYSDENMLLAQKRAYNGEYNVFDDGEIEPITRADRIEAQVTYTAMMTDTLLGV